MKKRYFYIVLIIFSLAFITFIVSGLAGAFSSQPQCKFVSLHQLLGADGLEMKWKLEGIKSAGYQTHDPYLMVKDGKIFFQGVINKGDPTQITILNAENGSFIATTEPTSYDTQFTTDGTALYIGIGHKGDLYKYDYATGQKVWSKHLGYVNGPCCFNIVNGELQMSWHLNHYYRVALDNGNIIMQNTREAVYREENEVFFYGLGANVLDAKGMEGKYIWRAFLNEEISQQPIFHNQTIFFFVLDREIRGPYTP